MQETYKKEVANIICEITGWTEALDIRDGGVFVKDEYQEHDALEQVFVWKPSCDMDWPDAPDPLTEPSLPIPFTAHELAAFMLDGVGRSIQDRLGPIGNGPDEEVLAALGKQANKVRKALREAYEILRQAQHIVGKLDRDQQQRAHELLCELDDANGEANEREKLWEPGITDEPEAPTSKPVRICTPSDPDVTVARREGEKERRLRRERAEASIAGLKADAYEAKAQADMAREKWRKAMVHQLLQPEHSCSPTATDVAVVDALMAEIEQIESDIRYWESRDDTRASDADIKQSKLKVLRARMAKLDEQRQLLRGDYTDSHPEPQPHNIQPAPVVAKSASNAPARARRDLLTPVLEAAQKECGDRFDAPAVWASLVRMAGAGNRPLLGVSDDGIKWQDSNDEPQFFNIKNLRDRLIRSKKKAR